MYFYIFNILEKEKRSFMLNRLDLEDRQDKELNPKQQIIPKISEYHYNVSKIFDMLKKLRSSFSENNE